MAYLGYSVSIYIRACTVIMEPPVSTWYFLQNGCMCVLKDIVNVKQLLDKILTSFIR